MEKACWVDVDAVARRHCGTVADIQSLGLRSWVSPPPVFQWLSVSWGPLAFVWFFSPVFARSVAGAGDAAAGWLTGCLTRKVQVWPILFFFLCICIYFTLFPIFFSSPSSASLGTGVSGCGSFYEYEWLSTRLLSHQLRWLVAFQFLVVAFCSFTCRFLLASGNPSSLLQKRRSYWSFYFQRCWVLFLIYIYIYIAFFSLNYWVLDLVCGSPFVWGFWFKLSSMTAHFLNFSIYLQYLTHYLTFFCLRNHLE